MKKLFIIFGVTCFLLLSCVFTIKDAYAGTYPAQFQVKVKDTNGNLIGGMPVTFGTTIPPAGDTWNCQLYGIGRASTIPSFWTAQTNFTGVAPLTQNTIKDHTNGSNGLAGTWHDFQDTGSQNSYGHFCSCNNQKVTLGFSGSASYQNYRIKSVTGTVANNGTGWDQSPVTINNKTDNSFDYSVNNDQMAQVVVIIESLEPTCSITASPSTVVRGSATTLTVTSLNASHGVYGLDGESYSPFVANGSGATMQYAPSSNNERMYARVFKTQSDLDAYMGNYSQWYDASIMPANSGICYVEMGVTFPLQKTCPTLSASPSSVRQGESVKLSWSGGQNVQSFDIKQQPPEGGTVATLYSGAQALTNRKVEIIPPVNTNYFLDVTFTDGTKNPNCSLVKTNVQVSPNQTGKEKIAPPN